MAGIISTIFQCISSFLWLCSQPVNLTVYIFQTNYETISTVFAAIGSALFYTAKALQLLVHGAISMAVSCAEAYEIVADVLSSVANGLLYVTKFTIQGVVNIVQIVYNYGPWAIRNLLDGVVWLSSSVAQFMNSVFVAAVAAGEIVLRGLVATWSLLSSLAQTLSGAVTFSDVTDFVSKTAMSVSDALHQVIDDLWHIEATVSASMLSMVAFLSGKLDDLLMEIAGSSSAFSSLADVFMNFGTVLLYITVFMAIFFAILIVSMKLYGLYFNAVNSSIRLVGLFQRALSLSGRHRYRREQRPPNEAPPERDALDGDNEDSLLNTVRQRRRPPVPQQHPQIDLHEAASSQGHHRQAEDVPGPSQEHPQNQLPRRSTPPPSSSTLTPPGQGQNPETAASHLARQLEEERDRQLCVVCQDNSKNILILPCKHLCICLDCVEGITGLPRQDARKCPLCRGTIRSYLEVYS